MAYVPSLADLPDEDKGYTPSISDLDEIDSVQNALSAQQQKAQAINNITGGNRTPIDTMRDLLSGALTGAAKGGEFLNRQEMRIPGAQNLATYLRSKLPQSLQNVNVSDQDVNQMLQQVASPNKSIGGNIAQGVGEYLPYVPVGGAGLGGQIASGAAFGAGTSAPGESATKNAIEDAALNAITHGVFAGANALRPSNLFRGNLTPQQLQQNLAAAGQTTTGLGDVIGSPFLKRQYENVISKLPFSGATEKLQQAGQAVTNKGSDILSSLLGNASPENVTDQLQDALMKNFKDHQAQKDNLYTNFNQIADQAGEKPDLSNFSDALQRNKDDLKNISILSGDPTGRTLFNKVSSYASGLSESAPSKARGVLSTEPEIQRDPLTGAPVSSGLGKDVSQVAQNTRQAYTPLGSNALPVVDRPTYQDANILKGRLLQAANTYRASPDASQRSLANVFDDLGRSLRQDVHSSVSETKNAPLINAYNQAEENYQNNFSKFLDKDIYKFISGKKDADTITQSFIKSSKSADRANDLNKLGQALGESRPLLSYSYFSRALDNEGNLNPAKLSTLIRNLGKNQFKALVPDYDMRNALRNYKKLYGMNVKGVNLMQNQATGQQALDILPALLAHSGSTILGGMAGGLPGALAGMVLPGLAARPAVSALTSPAVREALVRKMIANQPWSKKPVPYLQAALQGGTLNNQQGS